METPEDRVISGEAASLLVSFCNVGFGEGPFVALVRLGPNGGSSDRGVVEWIAPDAGLEKSCRGVTGLCRRGARVVAAYQSPDAAFRVLNPSRGFKALSGGPIPRGVHSVCSDGSGTLYFVVSREDAVYRATPQGRRGWRAERHWLLPGSSGLKDENHLNAVTFSGPSEGLFVSGFGRGSSDDWTLATQGFVTSLRSDEKIMEGVYHPHSLLWEHHSGRFWTCESKANRILSDDGRAIEVGSSSYLRGLASDDRYFYTASSKRRAISERTGKPLKGAKAERWGVCELYRVEKDTGKVETLMDFSSERNEIYDILPLP